MNERTRFGHISFTRIMSSFVISYLLTNVIEKFKFSPLLDFSRIRKSVNISKTIRE